MSRSDYFQTPYGNIYWAYEAPQNLNATGSRPTLLFIHAGVSDHKLWDEQVSYFSVQDWAVLRYDIFGYGLSKPTSDYLKSEPRPKVKHYEHAASIAKNLISLNTALAGTPDAFSDRVVVIGLSRGGSIALELAVAYPELVSGVVVVAGGLMGIDSPNKPEEDALLEQYLKSMKAGEVEKAALIFTRFWGDGPLVKAERVGQDVRGKLYAWVEDITLREVNRNGGGFCIPFEGPQPPAAERLSEIQVPVAIAMGKYDETSTTDGLKIIAKQVEAKEVKEFEAAHMINLERGKEFNAWVEQYLHSWIVGA